MTGILENLYKRLVPLYPYVLSMSLINVMGCYYRGEFIYGYEAVAFSDILLSVGVLALMSKRVRRWVEYISLALFFILEVIESFLAYNFNLFYEYNSLLLLFETNTEEAAGFVKSYVFSEHNITFYIAYLLLIGTIMVLYLYRRHGERLLLNVKNKIVCGTIILGVLLSAFVVEVVSFRFKTHFYNVMMSPSDQFIDQYQVGQYVSPIRLATAIKQVVKCSNDAESAYIVTSSADIDVEKKSSPNIVMLYIGESYVKRHSSLYGYPKLTTPKAMKELEDGNLFVFTDVISPFNFTSTTIKYIFSLQSVDEPGNWCNQPLFPYIFRRAGFETSFISNQFVGSHYDKESVVGDFFLDNKRMRSLLFDYANLERYEYDEGLLPSFNKVIDTTESDKLLIWHIIGQHTPFASRFPTGKVRFFTKDYQDRTDLNDNEKSKVAEHDNAVFYHDSIDGIIFDRLRDKDAIIVFVSDHGEEIFDFKDHVHGRQYNTTKPDRVRSEYEIPMWIWCSPVYRANHPDIVQSIANAKNRPYINTDVSHLLLDIAGINSRYFRPDRSVINKHFQIRKRPIITNDHIYEDIVGRPR